MFASGSVIAPSFNFSVHHVIDVLTLLVVRH